MIILYLKHNIHDINKKRAKIELKDIGANVKPRPRSYEYRHKDGVHIKGGKLMDVPNGNLIDKK